MTASEIKKIAEKYKDEYEYVGVRTQEEAFKLGTLEHCSSVWDDGDETAEMLDGISVTDVDSVALKMHTGEDMMCRSYYGDHLAIICGNYAQMGDDAGELVISDPVVVEVLA
jgi:hypothetical protein